MHSFQPFDLSMWEFNPFTKVSRELFLLAAGDREKANAMTAGWGGMGVIWGKNVVFVFVRESRYTRELMDKFDTFSVNFLGDNKKTIMTYFGKVSGRDEDKIANARMLVDYDGDTPYLDESNLVLICKKLSKTELSPDQFLDPEIESAMYKNGDYHYMYIGEIEKIMAR